MLPVERLRQRLRTGQALIAPGAFDALSARVIEDAGFEVVYATGAGIANTQLGWPDVGLLTFAEMLDQIRKIVRATNLPVIADADTGFGNPLNVIRTVNEYIEAGVAAIQIEDQVMPKRCGHFAGKSVVPREEAILRIRAAVEAADGRAMIIARTDARAVHGLEEALARAEAFHAEGAEILFVEAPRTIDELRQVGALPGYQVANMVEGGLTPLVDLDEAQSMGFSILLQANCTMRAAVQGMKEVLAHLMEHGGTQGVLDRMISMQERNRLTRMDKIREWETRYGGNEA